jgi:hypothetical protein
MAIEDDFGFERREVDMTGESLFVYACSRLPDSRFRISARNMVTAQTPGG